MEKEIKEISDYLNTTCSNNPAEITRAHIRHHGLHDAYRRNARRGKKNTPEEKV